MPKKRDYKKEYEDYQGTDEQKSRRAARNKARREAVKDGRVKKGDGKELDHIGFHRKGANALDNVPTRVVSQKKNRSRQPKRGG